jgi:lytic murein transglycosylase
MYASMGRDILRFWLALGLAIMAGGAPAGAVTLDKCVASIKAEARKAGIKPNIIDAAFRGITYDEKAVRFSRTQPEYRLKIWDYMAFLVDKERLSDGERMMAKYQQTLRSVEKAYGVDRYILAALWGVESDYGQEKGDFFLPHGLANVACAGRKPKVFRSELIQALRIVQAGDVKLADLQGSWAGAFGQTQFIPSTYRRLAVDFDGDGHRDTIRSVPDALASSANFLDKAGWQSGLPWGFEVKVPGSYKGPVGRSKKAPIATWAKRGLTRADGSALPKSGSYGLIRPAGPSGPSFLVSKNFDALYSYNAAESYALAIGYLSDRLRGKGALTVGWPTNDPGLSRAQRKRLQELLIAKGYYKGEADGRIGPQTAAAIKLAETQAGMKPTGRPGSRILKSLSGE